MRLTSNAPINNHSESSITWSHQEALLKSAFEAWQENNLEAFRSCIERVNLNEYVGLRIRDERDVLISGALIGLLEEHDRSDKEMYIQVILDQHPNFNLPYERGKNFSYLEFLTHLRKLSVLALGVIDLGSSLKPTDLEELEMEIDRVAHLFEIERYQVGEFIKGNREELEAEITSLDFILDQYSI